MKEPYFWTAGLDPRSRESAPLTRVLLTPLAWLYAAITAHKIKSSKPAKVPATVICVGNITAGGVGKSPIVAALRSRLSQHQNRRVATLSRGFGGSLKGPLKVDPHRHSAGEVGDEPFMLAQSGESWIGANRAAAGWAMSQAGVDIIIMDDGHQNPGLFKDFTFIVVDSVTAFGNGYVIPKGPLREPVTSGLARADAIIVMGDAETPEAVLSAGLPVLRATIVPTVSVPAKPYVAFAGIGRPVKFFDTLTSLGADIRDAIPFADHHVYSNSDLSYLRDLATDHNASLITTEKDLARLSLAQRSGITALAVKAQFEDTDLLDSLLLPVLKPAPE